MNLFGLSRNIYITVHGINVKFATAEKAKQAYQFKNIKELSLNC